MATTKCVFRTSYYRHWKQKLNNTNFEIHDFASHDDSQNIARILHYSKPNASLPSSQPQSWRVTELFMRFRLISLFKIYTQPAWNDKPTYVERGSSSSPVNFAQLSRNDVDDSHTACAAPFAQHSRMLFLYASAGSSLFATDFATHSRMLLAESVGDSQSGLPWRGTAIWRAYSLHSQSAFGFRLVNKTLVIIQELMIIEYFQKSNFAVTFETIST